MQAFISNVLHWFYYMTGDLQPILFWQYLAGMESEDTPWDDFLNYAVITRCFSDEGLDWAEFLAEYKH